MFKENIPSFLSARDDDGNVEAIHEKVQSIVKDVLEVEDVINSYEDLLKYGMTSMKFIEMILELEDAFGIEINDEYILIEYFSSINKIVQTLILQLKNEYNTMEKFD